MKKLFLKHHGSTILTFIGAVGVVLTAISAARASPKALKKLEDRQYENLTTAEKVITVIPEYVPTIVVGGCTLFCIFGSSLMNKKQQASLASAYALLDTSFKEYKAKLKELYGEEAHQNIVDSIMIEKAKHVDISHSCLFTECDLAIDDNDGLPRLFYDPYSKRYFETTIEAVLLAEYHLNRNFVLRGTAGLNEFYSFLGIDQLEEMSEPTWFVEDEFYWIDFNHRKAVLEDGLECCIVETIVEPRIDTNIYC